MFVLLNSSLGESNNKRIRAADTCCILTNLTNCCGVFLGWAQSEALYLSEFFAGKETCWQASHSTYIELSSTIARNVIFYMSCIHLYSNTC